MRWLKALFRSIADASNLVVNWMLTSEEKKGFNFGYQLMHWNMFWNVINAVLMISLTKRLMLINETYGLVFLFFCLNNVYFFKIVNRYSISYEGDDEE